MNPQLTVTVREVTVEDHDILRDMVAHYWIELKPDVHVIRDPTGGAASFDEQFAHVHASRTVWWTLCDDGQIGFVRVERWENHDGRGATIRDFYTTLTCDVRGWGPG